MSHRNAKLTPVGRRILVSRVLSGRPVAHVAKEMGVSRQCAHRWIRRYRSQGLPALRDRSSRPHHSPGTTTTQSTQHVLRIRVDERVGRDEIARRTGISLTTVSRIIVRAGLPALHQLDPVTGARIRASRRTQHRYERDIPGDLIHIDVKKLGRIPEGGGWRIDGSDTINHNRGRVRSKKLGMDRVHVAVDDHSRLAFVRVLPDETGPTCAQFLSDAADFFQSHGIHVREVMTDNALNYRLSRDFQAALTRFGAKHILTRPHSPWQYGTAERFNRTLQEGGPTGSRLSRTKTVVTRSSPGVITTTTLDLTPLAEVCPDQSNVANDLTEYS